ncbi:hypothetical protein [Neisseria meningitidis]|uniref:hypothetical protein n=1 Tax=Neisseria meningitidis TaxID=487 RepID=UPI0018E91B2F|nr:hypothetical protein [Neisseria meningitidis]
MNPAPKNLLFSSLLFSSLLFSSAAQAASEDGSRSPYYVQALLFSSLLFSSLPQRRRQVKTAAAARIMCRRI